MILTLFHPIYIISSVENQEYWTLYLFLPTHPNVNTILWFNTPTRLRKRHNWWKFYSQYPNYTINYYASVKFQEPVHFWLKFHLIVSTNIRTPQTTAESLCVLRLSVMIGLLPHPKQISRLSRSSFSLCLLTGTWSIYNHLEISSSCPFLSTMKVVQFVVVEAFLTELKFLHRGGMCP